MGSALMAGLAYFAVVFAVGFGLGVLRVTLAEPALGAVRAVALELPLILVASWSASRWLVATFRVPRTMPARLTMGALALALLLLAELALGTLGAGRDLARQLAAWIEPAGLLGLAGQVAFGLFPAVQAWLAARR